VGLNRFSPGDPLRWYGDPVAGEDEEKERDVRGSKARSKQPIGQQIREALESPIESPDADRRLDRQLDPRLLADGADPIAVLREIADGAIARLEAIIAEHRRLAEADDPASRLSFDPSVEGERLRRYQFSCSRNLFRSIDTFLKVRRSGVTAAGERQGSLVEPSSVDPPTDCGHGQDAPTELPVNQPNPQDEANDPAVHDEIRHDPSSIPSVPQGNSQKEPTAPELAASPRPWRSPLSTVVSAVLFAIFLVAGVRGHDNRQDEASTGPADHRIRQNEASIMRDMSTVRAVLEGHTSSPHERRPMVRWQTVAIGSRYQGIRDPFRLRGDQILADERMQSRAGNTGRQSNRADEACLTRAVALIRMDA
jgi:hypothetical protein